MLHLQRTDDLDESPFRLHAERTHLAGRDRAAAGAHRLLERDQQRGGAEHRLVQGNNHLVALAAPVAPHVLANHIDVAHRWRNLDAPLAGRCADDKVVQQHAAVDDAFLERIQMEHVGLHALAERLDPQVGRPLLLAQPPGLLQPGSLCREITQRHFRQPLHLRRDDPIARGRDRADVSAHGLGAGKTQRQELPRAGGSRLVFLEPQFQQQPTVDRPAEKDLEQAIAVRGARFRRVVGDVAPGDGDDGVVRRDLQRPIAQRRLAHLELEARIDDAVGLGQFIGCDLGHPDFGLDLGGEHVIAVVRRRETVDKHLPGVVLDSRAGELRRSELHHPGDIGHLEPHRPAVGHPHESGVPHPIFRGQAQRLGADGKTAEFHLACDDQRTLGLHRPAEPNIERAGRVARHDLPADDIRAFDADDFAGPIHPAAHAAQLALQDPEGEL